MLTALALGIAALPATAADVPLPSETPPAPGAAPAPTPGAAPSPPSSTPSAPTAPAAGKARHRTLRLGMSGPDVAALQHALKRRRDALVVDAQFGPRTKRAVKRQQKRFGMRATGVADARLQRRLRIRPRYRATALAPSSVGARFLREFPVRGTYTYADNFGAPRHQGRHEGVDIMAPRGTPVVAATAGRIDNLSRKETGLGGIWIWLRDGQGNTHYYAHLESIAAGLKAGTAVKAGQVIGGVGNTGDARGTLPHLHFELHPGDGAAVNPYRELRAVDPKTPKLKRR